MKQRINQYPHVVDCAERPEKEAMEPGTIYIEADESAPWLVCFLCPCGCGYDVSLVLKGTVQNHTGPEWVLERLSLSCISVHPSVLLTTDCGSHFWLKNNRIQWC